MEFFGLSLWLLQRHLRRLLQPHLQPCGFVHGLTLEGLRSSSRCVRSAADAALLLATLVDAQHRIVLQLHLLLPSLPPQLGVLRSIFSASAPVPCAAALQPCRAPALAPLALMDLQLYHSRSMTRTNFLCAFFCPSSSPFFLYSSSDTRHKAEISTQSKRCDSILSRATRK